MERPPSQRAQSAAVLLPALGVFLLMPPFITLFTGTARPFGIPLIVSYLFGVWVLLLLAAALLSWRLRAADLPIDPPALREGEGPTAPEPPA